MINHREFSCLVLGFNSRISRSEWSESNETFMHHHAPVSPSMPPTWLLMSPPNEPKKHENTFMTSSLVATCEFLFKECKLNYLITSPVAASKEERKHPQRLNRSRQETFSGRFTSFFGATRIDLFLAAHWKNRFFNAVRLECRWWKPEKNQ